MIDDPAKAIRRATLIAKGLSRTIGSLPSRDEGERVHPASLLPGVHVKAMEPHAPPDGYADGGDVEPSMPEPQRTVKAYKLFKTKKNRPGELFPLFVNANKPVEMGKWLAAEAGPPGKDPSKVKSALGDLAYRPGWHSGDLPVATHIGGKSSPDLKAPDYRPEHHVWAEVEHPADVDWQSEANRRVRMNASGQPIPNTAHITDQVPHGGFYRYKTNPNMTGHWLISGGMKVNRVLNDDEVKAINDAHGVADLPRRAEGGEVHDSPNFKRWFGDSKIVDAKGAPLRVFHGTSDAPHEFVIGHPRSKDAGWLGRGVYMTTNPDLASLYAQLKKGQAHPNVMPLYAKVENPYIASHDEKKYFRNLQNTHGADVARDAAEEWTQKLKEKGHDGVILHYPANSGGSDESHEIVAFHPENVKSVFNEGSFSPATGNIGKSEGGKVEPTDETGFDAWHGTPHKFEPEPGAPLGRFRSDKIGTGEGAQVFGHGLYLGEEGTAQRYKNTLRHRAVNPDYMSGVRSALASLDQHKQQKYDDALLAALTSNNQTELSKAPMGPDALPNFQAAARIFSAHDTDESPIKVAQYIQAQFPHLRDEGSFSQNGPKRLAIAGQVEKMRERTKGHIYHVRVNANPEHFLDWDKPLSGQSEHVQKALANLDPTMHHPNSDDYDPLEPGQITYNRFAASRGPSGASAALQSAGIPGIRYLDAMSRGPTDDPTHNHVIFDPSIIDIKRRYKRGGEVGHFLPPSVKPVAVNDDVVDRALRLTRHHTPGRR